MFNDSLSVKLAKLAALHVILDDDVVLTEDEVREIRAEFEADVQLPVSTLMQISALDFWRFIGTTLKEAPDDREACRRLNRRVPKFGLQQCWQNN